MYDYIKSEICCLALNKRIPKEIKNTTDDILLSYIDGLWQGDGDLHIENNGASKRKRLTTVSKALAFDLLDCLYSLGKRAAVYRDKCNGNLVKFPNGVSSIIHDKWYVSWVEEYRKSMEKIDDGYVYLRVMSVKKEYKVALSESFVSPFITR